jgi:stage II sporulation protein D
LTLFTTLMSITSRIKLFQWATLLLWLMTFGGCVERQVISPIPQMEAAPDYLVRVLLLDSIRQCRVSAFSSVTIIDPVTQAIQARFNTVEMPLDIQVSAGKITIAGRPFMNNEITISSDEPQIFSLNGDSYRGKLKLIMNSDANSFMAINLVGLEPYLAGVVGVEMPSYWEPAALRAQAIAARTYCLYIKRHFGGNRSWDVKRTQANQAYNGIRGEAAQVWAAVNDTKGQVLVCRQSTGYEDIFPTYYSAICGGHTESSRAVFGDYFEPLVGVPCSYCIDIAKPTQFYWNMAQFDKTDVKNRLIQSYPSLKQLGDITAITPTEQSNYDQYSRMTSIKLLGSTGKSDWLRAEDLRLTIDPTGRKIKSTICQIIDMGDKWAFAAGRGYGHGVGMCQCGAQSMARLGKTTTQILYYYYPSSKLTNLY